MNCDRTNPAIKLLKDAGWRDTYEAIQGDAESGFTFHGFNGPAFETSYGRLDWIFAQGRLTVRDARIVRDSENGRFPSDPYFIFAEVEL